MSIQSGIDTIDAFMDRANLNDPCYQDSHLANTTIVPRRRRIVRRRMRRR